MPFFPQGKILALTMVAGGNMEECEVKPPCTTINKQYNRMNAVSYNTIQGDLHNLLIK